MIFTKYAKFLESIQTKDMWDIIPESVKELHSRFKSAGKTLFVVGGSVRDFLNNEKPKDFDLATDATPDEVLAIIGKKWKTTVQGESFFVVVVYTEDQPMGMEIATFREDVYGDLLGKTRNPVTKFSTIDKDVERRDLTWNALFYDLEKRTIIDLVNGIEDLNNKITRFVGDPNIRIIEDPLRIMRLFRFTDRYGFTIEEKSGESIHKNKDRLKIIVHERIWDEFYKAYGQVKDFTKYMKHLDEFGLWEYIFPGMEINSDIVTCSSLELYLANLFVDNQAFDFEGFRNKLVKNQNIPDSSKLPIARFVAFFVWLQGFDPDMVTEFYSKRNNLKISDETLIEWFKITGLSGVNWYDAFVKYRPTTSSQDLMTKGFKGKALGDEIKRLEIENFKQMI